MSDQVVCPGDRLVSAAEYSAGHGTHVRDGYVCASLVGVKQVTKTGGQKPLVEVIRRGSQPLVPKPGAAVTAKVTKVNPRLASAEILCIGTKPVDQPFNGIIRVQDVRATEVDKVEMYSSFRPGDIVRAEVLSLGDSRSYYLSTAKNELGVVYAKSVAGQPMVAISWQEMQCPQTKATEKRKVAKVTA
ncbi:hypothetical protein WJX72_003436 [[Myrmecia] bisecta]|uniref:S1 motif domain-containing protein n=1 Tax=[Myrmecia] bisecta TaxID=41462 RepID=A0AAW1QEL2_9CHLO